MKEFCCVWFESTQRWVVVFPNGQIIDREFPAIGYAVEAAYEEMDTGSEWECTECRGQFYRYQPYDEIGPDSHALVVTYPDGKSIRTVHDTLDDALRARVLEEGVSCYVVRL